MTLPEVRNGEMEGGGGRDGGRKRIDGVRGRLEQVSTTLVMRARLPGLGREGCREGWVCRMRNRELLGSIKEKWKVRK